MVGAHCDRDVLTVSPEETVREIAKKLDQQDAGCAVVVDARTRPIGIVTDRDIAMRVLRRRRDPDRVLAGDVMTGELVKVREETPLPTAIRRMRAEGLRRIPVVGRGGRVTGLLTADRVIVHLAHDLDAAAEVAQAQRAVAPA